MSIDIVEETSSRLAEYAQVRTGLLVSELFDEENVVALAHGVAAEPSAVPTPYWKDYDSYPGGQPTDWSARFDVSGWIILAAFCDAERVGGAVVIVDDPRIELLRDCSSCALLWDIRVAPEMRGQGIGSVLLRAAEDRARHRGASTLRVETQQVNVPACRFYQHEGFYLERATPGAYADLPNEIQLLWRKSLTLAAPSG